MRFWDLFVSGAYFGELFFDVGSILGGFGRILGGFWEAKNLDLGTFLGRVGRKKGKGQKRRKKRGKRGRETSSTESDSWALPV